MSAVGQRYADALYAVAADADRVHDVRDGLALVDHLLREVPRLGELLANPNVTVHEKIALITNTLTHVPRLVQEFVVLLIRKARFVEWDAVHVAFDARYRAAQQMEHAVVRSARPLPPAIQQQIAARLEHWRQTTVELSTEVDPHLLGGIQVRIGSLLLDGAVRSQLDALADRLHTVPV